MARPERGSSSSQCPPKALPRLALGHASQEAALVRRLLAGADGAGLVQEAAWGQRFVAIKAQGRVGLASTLGARPALEEARALKELIGRPLSQCCPWLGGPAPFLASAGLAALNAACPLPPADQLQPGGAQGWLLGWAQGRRVVVVGDFPFGARLAEAAESFAVMELRPGSTGPAPGQWARALAACQLLAVSATALLSGSLAWFLGSAPQARKVVLGPSTPLSKVLFAAGAHLLAGSLVSQPAAIMAAVRQGLPYRLMKQGGIRQVCWLRPGWLP